MEGNSAKDDRGLRGTHHAAASRRDRGVSCCHQRCEFNWRGKMSEHKPSHGLLLLASGVLLAGTLLLRVGTRDVMGREDVEPQQRRLLTSGLPIDPTPQRV